MRLLIIILFCCASIHGLAQRPWILRTKMTSGTRPTVVTTSSSVFVFDTEAMRTFDHGVTWEPITSLAGNMFGVSDFTAGLTILGSYSELDKTVHMYYSLSGTSWTKFTDFPAAERPTAITASATEWYVSCGNTIYMFGDTLETKNLPTGARATDLRCAEGTLLALDPTQGLFYSADKGSSWKLIQIPNATSMHTSGMGLFLSTDNGVVSVNLETRKVSQVGIWPGRTTAPRISDVDSYINSLYCYSDDGSYQMYRLLGQNWEPIGYPLPGTKAARSGSVLSIDAGYAILAHALSEGFTDSAGIYSYDLNDFTDVDSETPEIVSDPYVSNNVLFLGSAYTDVALVEVWSASGEQLLAEVPHHNTFCLPSAARGVYMVRLIRRGAAPPRHILVVQ